MYVLLVSNTQTFICRKTKTGTKPYLRLQFDALSVDVEKIS